MKDYISAETEYHEAIKLRQGYAEAYNELGNIYKDKPEYDKAEKAYKEAIRLKPNFDLAQKNLELLLQKKKEPGK